MDTRRNLQHNPAGIEGIEVNDNNGWPTPLNDRSNPIKWVVTNGKLGETKDFRAMSTSGQSELSKPEGDSAGKGAQTDEGLTIKIKKTISNSAA